MANKYKVYVIYFQKASYRDIFLCRARDSKLTANTCVAEVLERNDGLLLYCDESNEGVWNVLEDWIKAAHQLGLLSSRLGFNAEEFDWF